MKTYLFSALFLILLGCSNYEPDPSLYHIPTHMNIFISSDDNSTVTTEDIRNIVSFFGNGSSDTQSRSVFNNDYTISTICDSIGNPSIYVVNFADNAGFVIVSATKNYHPILAYAETGNYDISRHQSSGLDIWEKNTIDAVTESISLPTEEKVSHNLEWLRYSPQNNVPVHPQSGDYLFITDEEYQELSNIYSRFIINAQEQRKEVYQYDKSLWIELMHNRASGEEYASDVYWMYEDIWQDFATLVYREEYSEYTSPITIQSKWMQRDGYNNEYRLLPNGELPNAGCGPVAAGQIMRYFQYPTIYNWSLMPLDQPTSVTSKFLFDIAESANATYGNANYGGGTTTDEQGIINAFIEFGYDVDKFKPANSNNIANSLVAGSPVFIVGLKENDEGHAWIVTQVHTRFRTVYYDVYNFSGYKSYEYIGTALQENFNYNYFYFNWGLGLSDGYFMLKDTPTYNKNMRVLLNIRPK